MLFVFSYDFEGSGPVTYSGRIPSVVADADAFVTSLGIWCEYPLHGCLDARDAVTAHSVLVCSPRCDKHVRSGLKDI